MKFKILPFWGLLLLFFAVGITACSPDDPLEKMSQDQPFVRSYAPSSTGGSFCGNQVIADIFSVEGIDVGDVEIQNDEDDLYVTLNLTPGWQMNVSFLYIGDCNQVPATNMGHVSSADYPYQVQHASPVSSYTFTIPLAGLDSCYCVSAYADAFHPYTLTNCPILLDFDFDTLGNQIPAGTVINEQWASWGIHISGANNNPSHPDQVITFDSRNPTGGDWDLGTPNAAFGGPGVGSGGAAGQPGVNATNQGNLLIIDENGIDANNDGLIDDPDDEAAGGDIYFDFDVPVTIESLTLVDLDDGTGGSVMISEAINGNTITLPIPNLGENSSYTVPVNTEAVDSFVVHFPGSGAIAQLRFCPETHALPTVVTYCTQACDDCEIAPGEFRTQTQGGWGTLPRGNNPGVYLRDNFANAFPNGLQVGCNFTLTLTSASAVTMLLPEGGPASALTQDLVNPTNTGNVLTGQIVALTLSVTFDDTDPNFGASGVVLGDLVIGSGVFQGWTVRQLLAEANRAYGGCGSLYPLSTLNDALSQINQNFVDGTSAGGYLVCPGSGLGTFSTGVGSAR